MKEENEITPQARHDIEELARKIGRYRSGTMDSEAFRLFRLARGIYGQRQDGVHMVRIKLPFGRINPGQLIRIAELSEEYGHSNLHITTRQDIQLHYVKLDNTSALWRKLEEKGLTLREACGNTIRNLTASPYAGIDPEEPFDVSPYAKATFEYFLRNPICQQLGRKFKITFSSSDRDAAYTFMHDLGFIPKVKHVDGKVKRGFKVLLAGGLGAQPFLAKEVVDFMPEEDIIPFAEACIRIFDRYGERTKRHKARLKYLLEEMGLDRFLELVHEEWIALGVKSFPIDHQDFLATPIPKITEREEVEPADPVMFEKWISKNVIPQKQENFLSVQIRVPLGDLSSKKAFKLADTIRKYASDDIRLTVNQGILLKFVHPDHLPALYNELYNIGLSGIGFNSIYDITACPGTVTCNLGIASATGLATELERVLKDEYADIDYDQNIRIKISGCMNGCAHHSIAEIGFHGMSMKFGAYVLPAMQVLLGGGPKGDGLGRVAEKIIRLPAKRIPDALRYILKEYEEKCNEGELFNDFFDRLGKNSFYELLKSLGEIKEISQEDLLDWGTAAPYKKEIGIGECAVPMADLVSSVLDEIKETINLAFIASKDEQWVEAIYFAYSIFINSAKAALLSKGIPTSSQHSILSKFDEAGNAGTLFKLENDVSLCDHVLRINRNEPSSKFTDLYLTDAITFYKMVREFRDAELTEIN